MVDTRRTLAALQTILADNTAGEISAQDARDMLVSTYADAFNVRNYGAVGDGNADDAAAINAAIAAAIAAGGGRIYLPSGVYKLGATLTIGGDNIVIAGDGAGASKLVYAGVDNTAALLATSRIGLGFRDFALDGLTAGRCEGLRLVTCSDSAIERVNLHDFTGFSTGVSAQLKLETCDHIRVIDCYVKDGWKATGALPARGIHAASSDDCEFIRIRTEGNGFEGIFIDSCDRPYIEGGSTFDNGKAGTGGGVNIAIFTCTGVRVANVNFRGYAAGLTGEQNLEVSASTDGVITACVSRDDKLGGYHIIGSSRIRMLGCTSLNSGSSGIEVVGNNAQGADNAVIGCIVQGATLNGIAVTDEGATFGCDRTLVQGNHCVGNGWHPVFITAHNNNTIVLDNIIHGNVDDTIFDGGTLTIINRNQTV